MGNGDYANARIRARKGRLLGARGIAELLAKPGLEARLEYLRRTDYGESVAAQLMRDSDPLRGAERGLSARLADDLSRIDRFLRGERARALFRAVLAFEDGWNLKTVLRGVTHGERPEQIFMLLAPTPEFGDPALGEMVRQKDIKGVVDLLTTWRSPYASPLAQAFARYRTDRELFRLDAALDQSLFTRALEAARRDGEDGRILLGLIGTQIDLANIGTLLKRADGGRSDDLFIAGGALVSLDRFRRLSQLAERDLRRALIQFGRLRLDPRLAAMDERADPFAVDRILQRSLREAMQREAGVHPLSLAVPLSFVLERRAEVQRIRLVLRGAEFGLPADELVALTEG
jgi:V/A-type H+-transporting ATPase subunit C